MKPLKSGLIILVVIAFLAGAYFITTPKKQSISDKNSAGINLSSSVSGTDNLYNSDEKNNLTKDVGQNLFEQIKKENKINPDFFAAIPDVNSISQKIIDDSLKNNPFNLNQSIKEADLKISQDNSKEAKIKYLAAIEEIGKNRMTGFNKNYQDVLSDVVEKNDLSSASRFADINKNMADDSLNLIVPSNLLDIHKKLITHFKNSELVFQAIADYPNDPIKAYLAVQAIDQMETNIQLIQVSLYQKEKEIGL